jgi:hypothetical protein
LVKRRFPLFVDSPLVVHHIFHTDTTMFTDSAIRDLSFLQQFNQEGTRSSPKISVKTGRRDAAQTA